MDSVCSCPSVLKENMVRFFILQPGYLLFLDSWTNHTIWLYRQPTRRKRNFFLYWCQPPCCQSRKNHCSSQSCGESGWVEHNSPPSSTSTNLSNYVYFCTFRKTCKLICLRLPGCPISSFLRFRMSTKPISCGLAAIQGFIFSLSTCWLLVRLVVQTVSSGWCRILGRNLPLIISFELQEIFLQCMPDAFSCVPPTSSEMVSLEHSLPFQGYWSTDYETMNLPSETCFRVLQLPTRYFSKNGKYSPSNRHPISLIPIYMGSIRYLVRWWSWQS